MPKIIQLGIQVGTFLHTAHSFSLETTALVSVRSSGSAYRDFQCSTEVGTFCTRKSDADRPDGQIFGVFHWIPQGKFL